MKSTVIVGFIIIIALSAFCISLNIQINKLKRNLSDTESELSETKIQLEEAEYKISDLHDRLYEIRSNSEDLKIEIEDLYYNRSSRDIEDVEYDADALTDEIEDAENESQ